MSEDELADLRQRVTELEGLVTALQVQNRRLKQVLAGDVDELSTWDVDDMVPLHARLEQLEDTVSTHEEKFEMFVVEDGQQAKPDQRALHLRQALLNRAQGNETPVAKFTRDQADSALGSTLHNGLVLDAMKRAANGHQAEIEGASDLQPVNAITFETGGTVGTDGIPEQSYILLDMSDLTGNQARQILLTAEQPVEVAD